MKIPFSSDKNIIFYLMRHSSKSLAVFLLACLCFVPLNAQRKPDLYRKGWIDFNKNQKKDIYEDPEQPIEKRVDDLLRQMTTEEKAGQLLAEFGWPLYQRTGDKITLTDEAKKVVVEHGTGTLWGFMRADPWTQKTLKNGLNTHYSVEATNMLQRYCIEQTRLGIPMFLAEECPHGHMAIGTTSFPTGIGQASTWNPDLLRQLGEAQAMEVRKQGGHIGYGPVIDLSRDPRWSRVEENFGEDTYLAGELGKAVVEGMQNNEKYPIISTVKHFTAYGWTEGGHNGGGAHIGENEMQELILPPFRKVVEAGLLSLMTSYNEVDGVPCTGNKEMITDLLKNTWGFKGFVVSDLFSIDGMTGHGVAANRKHAAEIAFNAGVESDLGGQAYRNLPALLKEGKITEAQLDEAVRKLLTLKFQWKLFDAPFLDEKEELTKAELQAHRDLAREVARQSITLLKNDNQTLPLKKDIRSIAVIGPNADMPYNMLGDYTAPQPEGSVITVLEGIKQAVGDGTTVNYAKGCAIRDMDASGMAEAKAAAEKSDAIVLVLGGSSARDFSAEFEATGAAKASKNVLSDMDSGEGNDRCTLDLLGRQNELLEMMAETGKPLVVVLIKGRPLVINDCAAKADAILDAWYPGCEGGSAIADVLFGDYNPAGRLAISVPKNVGQLPVFYNPKRGANRRDYIEGDAKPLYPFGFGLSYTTFAYDGLRLETDGERVKVRYNIKNIGKYDAKEVSEVYVRPISPMVYRPLKELKGFEKTFVKAGSTEIAEVVLERSAFAYWSTVKDCWTVDDGVYEIDVGASAQDIRLVGKVKVKNGKLSVLG